jgi:hypothetical protein
MGSDQHIGANLANSCRFEGWGRAKVQRPHAVDGACLDCFGI